MELTLTDGWIWLPLLAPVALFAVGLLSLTQPGNKPRRVLAASRLAAGTSLLVAAGTAVLAALHGPATSPLLGVISVRVDALSATMLALVAFLGAVVLRYSRSYLDGDPRHGAFLGWLATTVAAVMLLVTAGNLVQLVGAWIVSSFTLHQLLVFYPERPAAVLAARKKFLVARIGDVSLVAATSLLAATFDTLDLATLFEKARALEAVPPAVGAAAVLLVVTAAMKSAQFPTHGWLAEVMETPTPVSALLHAGILNGGAFLLARFSAVTVHSDTAAALMVAIGGFTALFASLVMITQSSVKVSLAYSSAAHMGFMMLACGLGAYPMAILHLVAHSCYKAHAFLSSGSAVEVARAAKVPGATKAPSAGAVAFSFLGSAAVVLAVGALFGAPVLHKPVSAGLALILALGLTQLLGNARGGAYGVGRALLGALVTSVAFYGLEAGAGVVLADSLRASTTIAPLTLSLMGAVIALFAAGAALQLLLPARAASPRLAALWVHLKNGLYANALFDRLVAPRTALVKETT